MIKRSAIAISLASIMALHSSVATAMQCRDLFKATKAEGATLHPSSALQTRDAARELHTNLQSYFERITPGLMDRIFVATPSHIVVKAARSLKEIQSFSDLRGLFLVIFEQLPVLDREALSIVVQELHRARDFELPLEARAIVGAIGAMGSKVQEHRKVELQFLIVKLKIDAYKNQEAMKSQISDRIFEYIVSQSPSGAALTRRSRTLNDIKRASDETRSSQGTALFKELISSIMSESLSREDIDSIINIYRVFVAAGYQLSRADLSIFDAIDTKGKMNNSTFVEQSRRVRAVKDLQTKLAYDTVQVGPPNNGSSKVASPNREATVEKSVTTSPESDLQAQVQAQEDMKIRLFDLISAYAHSQGHRWPFDMIMDGIKRWKGDKPKFLISELRKTVYGTSLGRGELDNILEIYRTLVTDGYALTVTDLAFFETIRHKMGYYPNQARDAAQIKESQKNRADNTPQEDSSPNNRNGMTAKDAMIERIRKEPPRLDLDLNAKKALIEEMRQVLATESAASQNLRDNLGAKFVKRTTGNTSASVSLLFGNSVESTKDPAPFIELAGRLAKYGLLVIFDGDSKIAPQIAAAVGTSGIALSSRERDFGPSVQNIVIVNDYIRNNAFKEARRVVISVDSVTGFGMAIRDKIDVMYDPHREYKRGQDAWVSHLNSTGLNLGVEIANGKNKIYSDPREFLDNLVPWKSDARPYISTFDLAKQVEAMEAYALRELLTGARETDQDIQKLVSDNGEALPPGGVVLGAGKNHLKFTKSVYDVVRAFAEEGMPIATGGAGGFMEVANAAAYDAGAHSIGIPMGRGKEVAGEKRVATEVQTKTVPARGYELRIPYLLRDRKFIILAPGGSGTIRELEVAFATISRQLSQGRNDQFMVFIGTEYYGKLVSWLKDNDALPQALRDSIYLVDTYEQAKDVYRQYEAKGFDMGQVRLAPPQPRNGNTAFESRGPPEQKQSGRSGFEPQPRPNGIRYRQW